MRITSLPIGLGILLATGCASQPPETGTGERAGGPAQSRPPSDVRDMRPRNSIPYSTP
jgi:hypothetical protein